MSEQIKASPQPGLPKKQKEEKKSTIDGGI
jgi:hypothetical protein